MESSRYDMWALFQNGGSLVLCIGGWAAHMLSHYVVGSAQGQLRLKRRGSALIGGLVRRKTHIEGSLFVGRAAQWASSLSAYLQLLAAEHILYRLLVHTAHPPLAYG